MTTTRRDFLKIAAAGAVAAAGARLAQAGEAASGQGAKDRVIICNEDSNTLSVINPNTNTIETTINLTSFDEDPRPPFRFVTGGVVPTHAAMVHKPLYHGAISIHGAAPSPDSRLLATTGRGTSNVYLVDTAQMKVIGNVPNPNKSDKVNPEWLSSGIMVGREPHEPTFTRNGKEVWVAVRGENRIAILDVERAKKEASGVSAGAVRSYVETIQGPAQVWFSADGKLAFVVSQKESKIDVFAVHADKNGNSHPKRKTTLDIKAQDPFGFTPFQKTTPDGKEVWFSHKLADGVSARSTSGDFSLLDAIALGEKARPNHVEFVENSQGKAAYVSLGRVDDGGPGGVASSRIAVIDRAGGAGGRKVVHTFFTHGRESHGLWTNPEGTRLYVAHEQDELPGTPNEGQTVCSVFDVSDPFKPGFVAQIALGNLDLPSGKLRNKKSINLVYVRPGSRSQAG
ncbi:MAG: YncE family protein [Pseudomonadota bacterium]|nr:MAG: YncE family protein [Pseudomonadota bacterium]